MARDKPRTEAQIREDLDREYSRWEYILKHGCQDPFWPDGTNMNLTRNHIIYHYRELREVMQEPVQLSLFDAGMDLRTERPVPPKVPENYMAPEGDHLAVRLPRISQFQAVTFSAEIGG